MKVDRAGVAGLKGPRRGWLTLTVRRITVVR
jgi:hypothetical protein